MSQSFPLVASTEEFERQHQHLKRAFNAIKVYSNQYYIKEEIEYLHDIIRNLVTELNDKDHLYKTQQAKNNAIIRKQEIEIYKMQIKLKRVIPEQIDHLQEKILDLEEKNDFLEEMISSLIE